MKSIFFLKNNSTRLLKNPHSPDCLILFSLFLCYSTYGKEGNNETISKRIQPFLFEDRSNLEIGDTMLFASFNDCRGGILAVDENENFYVITDQDTLRSYSNAGTLNWKTKLDSRNNTTPLIVKSNLLFASNGNKIVSYNQLGQKNWEIAPAKNVNYITSWADSLLLLAYTNKGVAIHDLNGNQLFEFPDLPINTAPIFGSNGSFYIVVDNKLQSYSVSGKLNWEYKLPGYWTGKSLSIGKNEEIYLTQNRTLFSISKEGEYLWKFDLQGSVNVAPAVGKDGTVYIGNENGTLFAISQKGELIWKYVSSYNYFHTATVLENETILIGTSSKAMLLLNKQGELIWSKTTKEFFTISTILKNGVALYVLNNSKILGLYMNCKGLANSSWPRINQNQFNSGFWVSKYTGSIVIENFPKDTTLCEGSNYSFDLSYNGLRPVDIKWYRNGKVVFKGSDINYSFKQVSEKNEGDYYCVLSNQKETVTSDTFRITVNQTPIIPEVIVEQDVLSTKVEANSTYQWNSRDSLLVNEITNNYELKQKGSFYVTITNQFGCSSSSDMVHHYNPSDSIYRYNGNYSSNLLAFSPNGVIYSVYNDKLIATDKKGKTIWQFVANDNISLQPVVNSQGVIFIFTSQLLYAINNDGTLKWELNHQGTIGDIAIGKNNIIYTGGSLLCAYSTTGEKLWSMKFLNSAIISTIDDEGLIYLSGDKIVVVHPEGYIVRTVPIGSNDLITVESDNMYVRFYDELFYIDKEGKPIWKKKFAEYISSKLVAGKDNEIYFVSGNKELCAVNAEGEFLWKLTIDGYVNSGLTLGNDDKIYLKTSAGSIYCVTTKGILEWKIGTGSLQSTPVYLSADKVLYTVSADKIQLFYSGANGLANSPSPFNNQNNQNTKFNWSIYSGKIKLNTHLNDTTLCTNTQFQKTISVTGSRPLKVRWFKNNKLLSEGDKLNFSIETIDKTSEGDYFCIVSNNLGADTSNVFKITVNEMPQKPFISRDGQTLLSSINGQLQWYWNDSLLINQNSIRINPTKEGCYWVVNENNNCQSSSTKYNFYNSFQKIEEKERILFYGKDVAVDDNNVIFYYKDGFICSMTVDGKQIDQFYFGTEIVCPIIISKGNLILCTAKAIQKVTKKGEILWYFDLGSIFPAVDEDGNVYFTYNSEFYALDKDGKLKWKNKIDSYQPSIVIDAEGVMYLSNDMSNELQAYNKNGKLKWKSVLNSTLPHSPSFGINGLIYVPTNTGIVTLSRDGKKVWEFFSGSPFGPLVIDEFGTAYGLSGAVYAITIEGKVKWKADFANNYSTGSLLLLDNSLYTAINEKYIKINRDGTNLQIIENFIYNSILNVCNDGTILFFSSQGIVLFGTNSTPSKNTIWPQPYYNAMNTSCMASVQNSIPQIIHQSTDTLICQGDKFYPYVTIKGTAPFTIEWFKDGKKIVSGENAYLKIDSIGSESIGSYHCVVSNKFGSVQSKNINIKVDLSVEQPVIKQNGELLSVSNANNVQWYINDSLTTEKALNLKPQLKGIYHVVSTTSNGCKAQSNSINFGPPLEVTWQKEIKWWGNRPKIYNSLAISTDGVIYFYADENLFAYNISGKMLWSRKLSSGYYLNRMSTPLIDKNGTIYYSAYGYKYDVFNALNPDGSLKFSYTINTASGDLALGQDGSIYVGSWEYISSFSSEGKIQWSFTMDAKLAGSPAIAADGTIYASTEGKSFYALSIEGKQIWKYTCDANIKSSPAIADDGTIYFGTENGNLYALSKDGVLKWKVHLDTKCYSPIIGSDGSIYVTTTSQLISVNTLGTVNWQYLINDSYNYFIPLIDSEGLVYVESTNKSIVALNTKGEIIHESAPNILRLITAPAIGNDGTLYLLDHDYKAVKIMSFSTNGHQLANSSWPKKSQGNQNQSQSNSTYQGIAPTLTTEFSDLSFCEKDKFQMTLSSKGDLPITYSSYKNGELIKTGRDSIFTIDTLSISDTGEYYFVASNRFGKSIGKQFTITVNGYPEPPVIKQEGEYLVSTYSQNNKWYLSNGEMLSEGSNSFKPNFSGCYYAVNEMNGCSSKSDKLCFLKKDTISIVFDLNTIDAKGKDQAFPSLSINNILYIPGDHRLYSYSPYGILYYEFGCQGSLAGTSVNGIANTSFVAQRSPGKILFAVDSLGMKKWEYNFEASTGLKPSVTSNNDVYMPLASGKVYALNYLGELLWNKEGFDSINGSISINQEGILYFGSNDMNLHALDANGNTLWDFPTGAKINSSPAIGADGTIYFGGNDQTFYALNPNGTLKWKYTSNCNFNSPVIDVDGTIYVTTSTNKTVSLSSDGKERWTIESNATPTPTIANDGLIYLATGINKFGAVNKNGEIVWENEDSFIQNVQSVLISSLGYLFIQFNNGEFVQSKPCSSTGLANSSWPKIYQNNQNTSCYMPLVIGHSPIISTNFSDISACIKKPFSTSCKTETDESVYVVWYKNGNKFQEGNNQALTIPSVSLSDAAQYFCIVKNAFGADTSNTFMLSAVDANSFPELYKTVIPIYKTPIIPLIDGIESWPWDLVSAVPIERNFKSETPTVNAYWKSLWSDKGIYLLVYVTDDNYYPWWETNGDYPLYDLVQLFFDINKIKDDAQGPTDYNGNGHYQSNLTFEKDGEGIIFCNQRIASSTPGGEYAYRTNNESYVMECFFPFNNFMNVEDRKMDPSRFIDMKDIGFDVVITDRDEGASSPRQRIAWRADGNNGRGEPFSNMDSCGIIRLAETLPICAPNWNVKEYQNNSMLIGIVSKDGNMVSAGDVIAAFVGGECRGKAVVEMINDSTFANLIINGEADEEEVIFRLWDVSECKEYISTNTIKTKLGKNIGSNGEYVQIRFGNDLNQEIVLKKGLNLKSVIIKSDGRNIDKMIDPDEFDTLRFSNFSSEYLTSDSEIEDSNSLKSFVDGEAYFVESSTDCTLNLNGFPIKNNYNIDLNNGSNLVGYPYSQVQSVEKGFQQLVDSKQLLLVKNLTQSYDPQMPEYLNTLKSLVQGEGYNVSIVNDYPDFSIPVPSEKSQFTQFDMENSCSWDFVGYKNSTVKYFQFEFDGNKYSESTKIGAFVNGECRAIAPMVVHDGKYYSTLVINTNDLATCEIVICSNGSEQLVTDSLVLIPNDVNRSVSLIDERKTDQVVDNLLARVTIYPNPAKEEFSILLNSTSNKNASVEIFNYLGQQIMGFDQLDNAGKIDVNTNGWRTGFYLIRIKNDQIVINRKIEIIR